MSRLRNHLVGLMPLYAFLLAYFVTTVLGNLLYITSIGRSWPSIVIDDFSWDQFHAGFGIGFWTLLLVPFIAVPAIALITRRLMRPVVDKTAWLIADFWTPVYVAVTYSLLAVVFYKLYSASAVTQLLSTSTSANMVIEGRFSIQDALGTWTRIAIFSPLIFLTVYSGVRSSRDGGMWTIALAFNTAAMAAVMLLLSMKWPLILFFITLALVFFVTSKSGALPKAIAMVCIAVVAYLIIAVVLMRLAPKDIEEGSRPLSQAPTHASTPAETARAVFDYAPRLGQGLVNRMAMPVLYYWEYFTTHPGTCGTWFDSVFTRDPNQCHPSKFIYARMYPNDGFAGRGTTPAASHIYEYARAGWPGAVVAVLLSGVLIGLFLSLWPAAQGNPTLLSAFIMGGPAAYLMSQIPLEGVVFYDNGVVWWSALAILMSVVSRVARLTR